MSRNAVREIKARIKLVDVARRYLDLKHAGGARWVAPCPFHQETKPSFSINEEEGFFYCFGCQASGDLFDFYGRINGTDFRETLEALAAEAHVSLDDGFRRNGRDSEARHREMSEKNQMLRMHEIAEKHFSAQLFGTSGVECREYMQSRGIDPSVAKEFGLGWSTREWQSLTTAFQRSDLNLEVGIKASLLSKSGNGRIFDRFRGRFMFPIRNLNGSVVAFGGRIIADEDEAKYINSSDTPIYKKGEHLFGLYKARKAITTGTTAMLTEGYMDVLTLHQFGYSGAVGVLGTALTPDHIRRLSGFTSHIELLFDGDRAGRKAAFRSASMLLMRGLSCRVVLFPEQEDIDSLLKHQGVDTFEKLRRDASEGLAFCVKVLQTMAPRDAIEWSRDFLKQVEQVELVSPYASAFAQGLGISEKELRGQVMANRVFAMRGVVQGETHFTKRPLPPVQSKGGRLEREILSFAVRYPHTIEQLRNAGAHLFLRSSVGRALWDKLEHTPPDEIFRNLDEREKNFWVHCRGEKAAPLTNEIGELNAVLTKLKQLQLTEQLHSSTVAIREMGNSDFEANREFLRINLVSLEENHGKH